MRSVERQLHSDEQQRVAQRSIDTVRYRISIGDNAATFQCQALWDTGATGCVITERIAAQCGLAPIGVLQVFGVHGAEMVNAYLVNLHLPNDVVFENLRVTEGMLGDDIEVLIGMDVITRGDFAVTNKDGLTVFTFRIPFGA